MKKLSLRFIMAILLGAGSLASAEVAELSSAENISKTIASVESAIIEVNKGDFSNANQQIRAARSAAEQIDGDNAILKQAADAVRKGQNHSKSGEGPEAAKALSASITLYKSL